MIADITVAQFLGWVGGSLAFLTVVAVAVEKVFGPFGKWAQRIITRPLSEQLEAHAAYVGYHLGPNGDTQPIHKRLASLEEQVAELRSAQAPPFGPWRT